VTSLDLGGGPGIGKRKTLKERKVGFRYQEMTKRNLPTGGGGGFFVGEKKGSGRRGGESLPGGRGARWLREGICAEKILQKGGGGGKLPSSKGRKQKPGEGHGLKRWGRAERGGLREEKPGVHQSSKGSEGKKSKGPMGGMAIRLICGPGRRGFRKEEKGKTLNRAKKSKLLQGGWKGAGRAARKKTLSTTLEKGKRVRRGGKRNQIPTKEAHGREKSNWTTKRGGKSNTGETH